MPAQARAQIRYEVEVRARSVTIVERRAPWRGDQNDAWTSLPIARFGYSASRREWTLYWRDRNLRFHRYERMAPVPDVSALLSEVTADPTGIFWG